MKINAANNQEKKDYLAYLPFAMKVMLKNITKPEWKTN